MTGSTSGGTKTAHLRLESGGKGGWVAKEEIVNDALYDERMSKGFFFSEFWGAKFRVSGGQGRG